MENRKFNIKLRKGERRDCDSIATLIRELAEYERQPEEAKLNGKDLERDGFDSDPPYFYLLVAELIDEGSEENGNIIGFGMWHYAYNLWSGKDVHLEDFYVKEEYRCNRVGEKILRELAKVAIDEDLPNLTFECANWNEPALKFYKKHGAVDITLNTRLHNYRYVNSVMKQLAKQE